MPDHAARFTWHDYDPLTMPFIETWLDERAVCATGLDEGFRSFYTYWAAEEGFDVGENFWCRVAFSDGTPLAVIAFCLHEGTVLVMEIVVEPHSRGRGVGTQVLKELLGRTDVAGFTVQRSEAVIFPDNVVSQRAFGNAGYRIHHAHEDGSALYYLYERDPRP